MSRCCPGCGLNFGAHFGGDPRYCCGHCERGTGEYGRRCEVRLTCASCSNSLPRSQGKYIHQLFYCCGHCKGTQHDPSSNQRGHSQKCIFSNTVPPAASGIGLSQQSSSAARLARRDGARSRSRRRRNGRCITCLEEQANMVCVPLSTSFSLLAGIKFFANYVQKNIHDRPDNKELLFDAPCAVNLCGS